MGANGSSASVGVLATLLVFVTIALIIVIVALVLVLRLYRAEVRNKEQRLAYETPMPLKERDQAEDGEVGQQQYQGIGVHT